MYMSRPPSVPSSRPACGSRAALRRGFLAGVMLWGVAGGAAAPATAHIPGSRLEARRHVVHRALSQLDVPYRMGAESPRRGFDCSGLTKWAFYGHGALLPHSSRLQFRLGGSEGYRRVWSRNRLRAGDLVFFDTSGRTRVGHVGIYVGDGEFVSAASSGVSVASVFDPYYWGKRWVGATRVRLPAQ